MLRAAFERGRMLLLLDGLDEAGEQKGHIERYIAAALVPSARLHVVVSSRHTVRSGSTRV